MSAINIWLTCVLLFIVVNVGGGGTVPEYCLGRAIGCLLFITQLNSIGLSVPHRKHITSPLRAKQVNAIYIRVHILCEGFLNAKVGSIHSYDFALMSRSPVIVLSKAGYLISNYG
jgi:hypothetical protein